MSTATLTSKGQITIPIDVRTKLGIGPGDRLDFVTDSDGQVRVLPVTKDISSLKGMVCKPDKPVIIEDMDAAIHSKAGRL